MGRVKKIIDYEKIAAGEVVERPASVVKELVENSIDAGANEIKIIVKGAGKSLIQIIDDGFGIEKEDVEVAFERYTSGKIERFEDLNSLKTLGFRGEALSSIATVSQVELITRTKNDDLGTFIIVHGGEIKEKKELSAPIGTNIKVKNLFFNIPARRKFLKSDKVELGHITDIITRYALVYPEIHFLYKHNELEILNCPSSHELLDMVFHIYGKQKAKKMQEIKYSHPDGLLKISGLLGEPEISLKNRRNSSLFVNKRYVISDYFFEVINAAYKGFLMIGRQPFFIINLDVDPASVDFNIHPKKLTIRFNNEKVLFPYIENALRARLEDLFLPKKDKGVFIPLHTKRVKVNSIDLESEVEESSSGTVESEDILPLQSLHEDFILQEMIQTTLLDDESPGDDVKTKITRKALQEQSIITDTLPKMRPISISGQLSNKIYVLFESEDENGNSGILILDQHAASERIMKEKFQNQYKNSNIQKQQLISPLKLKISPAESFFIGEHLTEINSFGFELEEFGGNTFILRAIPAIFGKLPKIQVLPNMIEELADIGRQRSFTGAEDEIINYLSCHKAVRGGDYLNSKSIRKLVIDLSKCEDPNHCAHGRPTYKFISFKEFDKMFKRIV